MGLAAAEVLVADGARVAVAGRDAGRAREAAEALGPLAVPVTGDVNVSGGADTLVAAAVEALGGLAGIAITTGTGLEAHSRLADATDEIWSEAFDDVLMGTVRAVRAAVPHLVANGGGTVVTTGAYGMRAYHPDRLPYVTLKYGVAAFTKTIAREYGPAGVRAELRVPRRDRDEQPPGAPRPARGGARIAARRAARTSDGGGVAHGCRPATAGHAG